MPKTIKKVMMYQTADGSIFSGRDYAEQHSKRLELRDWYYEPKTDRVLYSDSVDGGAVSFDELIHWIETHRDQVIDMLGATYVKSSDTYIRIRTDDEEKND